jgi:pyruvate dehydrogenase E2 component (dihydrolipoamide acetyltransferase)
VPSTAAPPASVLVMPRLSDSMDEGTILRWLRSNGDAVRRGEELLEVETDKATMTHEADADGILRILVAEGETVAIGTPIAELADAGTPAPVPARTRATPVARRIAAEHGIDLAALTASGPRGRVVRADIEAALAGPPAAAHAATATPAAPEALPALTAVEATREVALSRLQRTVARRMAEAKASVPEFEVEMDVDMGECVALRRRLREASGRPAPSHNDLVIKACAMALRDHPRVNGSYRDGSFLLYDAVHVGFAVAADDALLVPVVRDADRLSLGALAAHTRDLAQRARVGALTAREMEDGTFTVSNLGAAGVDRFTAVINAPQSAILAVGAIVSRPWAVDGAVLVRPVVTLRLTCDHRILYGADGAAFLAAVRRNLEEPLGMLL